MLADVQRVYNYSVLAICHYNRSTYNCRLCVLIQMSGLGPMLLQSLENAMELFAKSAQMTSKGCRLNITRTNIGK